MFTAIRDRLEEMLRPARAAKSPVQIEEQLAALRSLKGPSDVDLPAGFYAGVLRKIEEKKNSSVWYNLVMSPISTRLVYATFTAALLIGTYVISAEARDGHLEAFVVMPSNMHYDAAVDGNQDQQRNAVLTNFATH